MSEACELPPRPGLSYRFDFRNLTEPYQKMQIAPGVEATEWQGLKLDDSKSADWDVAVDILSARITERYIAPVDFLIASEETKSPSDRRFGFTVLAIDCMLVETLGAFIEGLEDTDGKSKRTFCNCLRTRPLFGAEFTTDDIAEKFYKQFRCGILHQAESGGESKVWSVGPILFISGNSIIVNRNKFHDCVKAEFQRYLSELRDPKDSVLRNNFRKKMDFICRS
jgi:hypothetical protein